MKKAAVVNARFNRSAPDAGVGSDTRIVHYLRSSSGTPPTTVHGAAEQESNDGAGEPMWAINISRLAAVLSSAGVFLQADSSRPKTSSSLVPWAGSMSSHR